MVLYLKRKGLEEKVSNKKRKDRKEKTKIKARDKKKEGLR